MTRKHGKRGAGEGSIYQRNDGRWTASVSLGYSGGKRKRKVIYGKTRKDVADKLVVLLREQQQGARLDTERQTVEQFLRHWLEHVVKPTRRPSTYTLYASHIRRHLVPVLGSIVLERLTPQDVQAWISREAQAGVAPSTIRTMLIVLRAALGTAVEWQLATRNVASRVKPPRVPPTEVRVLTRAEARRLLDTARGDRLEALYTVALAIGLRLGEALGLRWQEIDLDTRRLRISMALQNTTFGLILGEPKTRSSYRTIELPSLLVAALRAHRARQRQEQLLAGLEWHDNNLVFCRDDGRPMYPSTIHRQFHALLQRAGLAPMRFHDLRHSCVSFLAAQGLSQRQAMDLLGHSTIGMTMNVYTHVLDERRRDAADIMDRLLGDEHEGISSIGLRATPTAETAGSSPSANEAQH